MSLATLYRQGYGAKEFLLIVEAVEDSWSSCLDGTWTLAAGQVGPDPVDFTVRPGFLSRDTLRFGQKVDPGTGELTASDLTFALIDGEDDDGNTYSVSRLMSRRAGAGTASLAATLAAGAASMQVDSTAAFTAPGVVHVELEAIGFSGIAAGPPRLTGLTRGL